MWVETSWGELSWGELSLGRVVLFPTKHVSSSSLAFPKRANLIVYSISEVTRHDLSRIAGTKCPESVSFRQKSNVSIVKLIRIFREIVYYRKHEWGRI